ncbi:MAG: DNA translocase FtsK [Acidobacteriota bacterium]|nr:MAG: DNA translocase FtsK [Acidobacteriota bacterium]
MNDIGTGVVFGALLLASIVLVTSFSYSSFFESIHLAASNFRIRFGEWRERRKALNATAEAKPAAKTVAKKVPEPVQRPLPTISDGSDSRRIEPEQDEPLIADGSDVFRKIETAEGEAEEKAKAAQAGASAGDAGVSIEAKDETEEPADSGAPKEYQLPSVEFLTVPAPRLEQDDQILREKAKELTQKADEFNVKGKVEKIGLGPVVTTYEFKPDAGVKYARVTGLADDLCLALEAESVMIERIPGTAFVGIEVPNEERETIFLRDVIESDKFQESTSLLSIALGKRIDGSRQIADLAKMPHLLIAGATGAGKSVGVNSLIVSILYKAKPEEVKFIMVDPKRLELGVYADIPHLAAPIITEPKRASTALKWAVSEMERRYKDLAGWGVRNIDGYNNEVRRRNSLEKYDEEGNPHRPLPYIVIIIDELADLMMVSGKEVEESITRLAQMARAVGIHLVLATQRPSVDVITGLIKANFPARISFRVSSKIDSRTIIDANGAERLLGKGDMLFLPPATSQLIRVHGAYVDEKEIRRIVDHIKAQAAPEYDETITQDEEEMDEFGDLPGRKDELFEEALKTVVGAGRASTSLLQRHLRIGYGRAAAILDALVADGFIGDMDSTKRARPVLQKAYEAVQEMEEGREF